MPEHISPLAASFNGAHILAISQAICQYRRSANINGPLFLGMDRHAVSEPAFATASDVLIAGGVEVRTDAQHGDTPTPVISHAITPYVEDLGNIADMAAIRASGYAMTRLIALQSKFNIAFANDTDADQTCVVSDPSGQAATHLG